MLVEHLIYSSALAVLFGLAYRVCFGRELSWLIILSAYAPDSDILFNSLLNRLGVSILVNGHPIIHGSFHNIFSLILYMVLVAFLIHPLGFKFLDSTIFAGMGFGAHLLEDFAVFSNGYSFLWPLSHRRFGVGHYHPTFYGIADPHVLIWGLVFLGAAVLLRTLVERRFWLGEMIPGITHGGRQ